MGNHTKAGFITALSSVRGGGLYLCSRELIRREYSPGLAICGGFFQSAEADFTCVAATLFAQNIHRGFVRIDPK